MNQKLRQFIETLHAIWLPDALSMDEFMDVIDLLMVRHGMQWKEVVSYVNEAGELISPIQSADALFYFDVNDQAHDKYPVFEATCLKYMEVSNIQSGRLAA